MPAKSKAQQRFMGIVRATQKGKFKSPSKAVQDAAKNMSAEDVRDFAATKHEGLPNKKDEDMTKNEKKAADMRKVANLVTNYVLLKMASVDLDKKTPKKK